MLPSTTKSQRPNPDSDSDEYYEEPDSPRKTSPLKPSREANVPPAVPERKDSSNNFNDLNELPTRIETAEQYRKAWHTPEAEDCFKKLTLELEREEKEVYMSVGRGRGPHQIRNYISRPSVEIKKEIPHCHGLPVSLALRDVVATSATYWEEAEDESNRAYFRYFRVATQLGNSIPVF